MGGRLLHEEEFTDGTGVRRKRRRGGGGEGGYDHAQAHKKSKTNHSIGFLFIRHSDAPPGMASESSNVDMCALYPGPRHGGIKDISILQQPFVEDMRTLAEEGVEVEDCWLKSLFPNRPEVYRYVYHYYLLAVHADSPARCELAQALGLNSYKGDYRSMWRGNMSGKHVYYAGYDEPQMQSFPDPNSVGGHVTGLFHANDTRLWINSETMKELGELTILGTYPQESTGFKGVSPFVETAIGHRPHNGLPYFDVWSQLPFDWPHAGIWGVLKKFWRALVGPQKSNSLPHVDGFTLEASTLQGMRERGRNLQATHDSGRRYECLVDHQGFWIMEDWEKFALIYSDVVVGEVLHDHHRHPELGRAWDCLKEAIRYYMRPTSYLPHVPLHDRIRVDAAREARAFMWEFARISESVSVANGHGYSFCPPNLRLIAIYSDAQEKALGSPSTSNSYFVEQNLQVDGKRALGAAKVKMEEIMANKHLGKCKLLEYKIKHGLGKDVPSLINPPCFLGTPKIEVPSHDLVSAINLLLGENPLQNPQVSTHSRYVSASLEEFHSETWLRTFIQNSRNVELIFKNYKHGTVVNFLHIMDDYHTGNDTHNKRSTMWARVKCYAHELVDDETDAVTVGDNDAGGDLDRDDAWIWPQRRIDAALKRSKARRSLKKLSNQPIIEILPVTAIITKCIFVKMSSFDSIDGREELHALKVGRKFYKRYDDGMLDEGDNEEH